jgi:hypothetical protein
MVPVEKLVPYARNARTHTPEQVDQIAASIVEFGWTMPVLVDPEGVLIAGHGRVMAAHKLGLAKVPASVATTWTAAQIKAHRLTDNKLALNAGWDGPLLKIELDELRGMNFDLALTGFSLDEIEAVDLDQEPAAGDGSGTGAAKGSLAARFGVPPFTVLNAREGWWQDRKRAWLALGIQSELGRGGRLLSLSDQAEDYRTRRGAYA